MTQQLLLGAAAGVIGALLARVAFNGLRGIPGIVFRYYYPPAKLGDCSWCRRRVVEASLREAKGIPIIMELRAEPAGRRGPVFGDEQICIGCARAFDYGIGTGIAFCKAKGTENAHA